MIINNFKGTEFGVTPYQNLKGHLKISTSDEKSSVIENPVSNKISFADNYLPDYSILDTVHEGETFNASGGLTTDELIAFDKLPTDKIINDIDFTNTTQGELYATLSTLSRRGAISGGSSSTVGMDGNLSGGKRFNALEYFEKSLQGLRSLPAGSHNSEIPEGIEKTFNAISAIHNMKQSGQTVMSVNETV